MGNRRNRQIRWLTLAAILFLGGWPMVLPKAYGRSESTIRLGGINYVEAISFGAGFGLKSQLTNSGRKLTLKSAWTTIELEADSRECQINGLRIFLGDATKLYKGSIRLSELDAEKVLAPILLAGSGQKSVPGLKLIVIDPGHGGRDPGKENRRLGVNEKTLTLDTARRLQKILETMGYRVVMTRTGDEQLSASKASDLQLRAERANKLGADLFISLHFNAVSAGADRVTGVEVYTLTPRTQFSTADPEREDDQGASEINAGNATDHWNMILGYQVHHRMIEELSASDRGMKRARWAVLRYTKCPAILVECGFLSNDNEARKIATPAYRQQIAVAVANGIQAYGNILAGVRKQRASD